MLEGDNELTCLSQSIETRREELERLLISVKQSSLEMKNTAHEVTHISNTITQGSEEQHDKTVVFQESIDMLTALAATVKEEIEQSSKFVSAS